MHISHCSTLKITPITDLCLQQSDKKKSALMHLQPGLARILAARRNKTMRGEGKRNKEGACFIFHLQLFCCCFLEGRRGEGRRVRMELYVEVESAAASSLQQPSTSRGEKNRTQGHMFIARTCDWPSALYVHKPCFKRPVFSTFYPPVHIARRRFSSSLPLFWFSSLHCLSFSPRPRSRLTC